MDMQPDMHTGWDVAPTQSLLPTARRVIPDINVVDLNGACWVIEAKWERATCMVGAQATTEIICDRFSAFSSNQINRLEID